MKQQVWKAGVIAMVVMAVTGSAVWAAAAPVPAKSSGPAVPAPAPAASTAPAKPAAPPHQELIWPELWQTFHHPAPWLEMGLDHRFRIETGENWQTLNRANGRTDDWMYQRYRTRWWTKWTANEDITFNTRLVWEFRTWEEPRGRRQIINPGFAGYAQGPFVREGNPDEALFDWFNVSIRNLGGLPLTATIGRQDMIFGVGWLVLDATPNDGSRTIGAFDAARFTYDWAEASTKIDLVYVDEGAESDRFLEPINDQDRGLREQDERGGILYVTNTRWKPVQLEGFFIYRNDNPINEQLSNFPYGWTQRAETYTLGGAVAGTQGDHWKYRTEGAMQFGKRNDTLGPSDFFTLGAVGPEHDVKAYGSLSTIEYMFKDSHDNATHLTYEYASGDDPATEDNEQFDLLWGEWPRWSELLIYTYGYETQLSNTTNLHRLNLGHRFNLNKQWSVTGDYHALWADQNTGGTDPLHRLAISPTDRFRGHLLTTWWRYKFSEQMYGHFLFEYFINGDSYFVAPSDDNAWFFRFNFEYVF